MALPARAASIRGDRYHHTYAWNLVCKALLDEDLVSISVEDRDGGAFDDVVIRRQHGPDEYYQLKSSNYAGTPVDSKWLMAAASAKGKSPLQRYYATYEVVSRQEKPFRIHFVTNRFPETGDAMFDLVDLLTYKLDTSRIRDAKPGSWLGNASRLWAEHLDIEMSELLAFLGVIEWTLGAGECERIEMAKGSMKSAGLRDDSDAVTIGRDIVENLVIHGVGSRSRAQLLDIVTKRGLIARTAVLSLVVNAVDHAVEPGNATVALDLVDLFDGDTAFTRRRLSDPDAGSLRIASELESARTRLEREQSRIVHVSGNMRLPLYFAVGRTLPRVRDWTLSLDYRGSQWSTGDAYVDPIRSCIRTVQTERTGEDLAVGIALTKDISGDIAEHISTFGLGCATIFLATPPDDRPGQESVASAQWLNAWIHDVRPRLSALVCSAKAVHLFVAAPAPAALFLGHNWNEMPPTIVYAFDSGRYYPECRLS